MKMTTGEKIYNIFNISGFTVFSLLCIFPFIYVIALSLNDGLDAMRGGIYLWPRMFTVQNYITIFNDNKLISSAIISIYRTVTTVCLTAVFNSCFAFAISKKRLPGRKFFNWLILIPMYFGGGMIPYFLVCKQLGLVNNVLVYVLPSLIGSFYIIMQRSYFAEMPDSLEESAKLDGAGYFTIFFRIYLPLSGPMLATVMLLTGIDQWNDWFTGSIMVYDTNLWPLQTLLLHIIQGADVSSMLKARNLLSQSNRGIKISVTVESVKMAVLVVTVAPIILIYPFFQKYFIKGMMIGSIKG